MDANFANTLYYGDNLDVLQKYISSESIDLIYLDPPFKSSQDYNILFREQDGSRAAAQIKAFHDTWRWDQESSKSFHEVVLAGGRTADVMVAFEKFLGHNDMLAYLSMMAPRIVELKRVLKNTGSIYLHCDTTASHYLKILMDAIFGPENFSNEIIWRRTASNKSVKRFGPIHQSIFFYRKSKDVYFNQTYTPYIKEYIKKNFRYKDNYGIYRIVILTGPGIRSGDSGKEWRGYNPSDSGRHWQPASYLYQKYEETTGQDLAQYPLIERLDKLDEIGLIYWPPKGKVPGYKYYLDDAPGLRVQDLWFYQPGTEGCVHGDSDDCIGEDIKWLSSMDRERLSYPTQKPEGLLKRIIMASSKEGDIVLDPFCGCGTTVSVAQQLNRSWIGIDITHLAISLIKHRLRSTFVDSINYKVIGEPVSLPDARTLAKQDPYQFQWWALGLVGARPVEQKKGADRGIDGRIYFFPQARVKGKPEQIIFSVKAGNITVSHIRDLVGVINREKAAIGVFISLNKPTRPMRREAASAGFYESVEVVQNIYPRIQLLTIEELLDGKHVEYPSYAQWRGNVTLKKAPKTGKLKKEAKVPKLEKFNIRENKS